MSCFCCVNKLGTSVRQIFTHTKLHKQQLLNSVLWHHPVLFAGIYAATRGYLLSAGSLKEGDRETGLGITLLEMNHRNWVLKRVPEPSHEMQRVGLS